MAWYDYGSGFRPYVSVGERRARATLALVRLGRKRGRPPQPVAVTRRRGAVAITFWGKAWCDNLERYRDFANRLPRGRTYLRNGSVVDLVITGGTVEALVAGSGLYRVRVEIARMKPARWRALVGRCTGRIGSLVGLLRGELSPEVLAVLTDAKEGVFPEPREITMECSCPDWAGMCKHIAAVLYGVGARLDESPELFFTLRRVKQTELLSSVTSGALTRTRAGGGPRLAAGKLAEVFGIDIEDDGLVSAKAAKPTPVTPRRRRGAAGRSPGPRIAVPRRVDRSPGLGVSRRRLTRGTSPGTPRA
jgi:uncharacterized Zn finger protein